MRGRIAKILPVLPWLVWDEGAAVLGYAYASAHNERAAYQWSVNVSAYVHPSARRRGIATTLYRRVFEILALQGYQNAYAGITLPNPASVRLHESVGFTQVGVYRHVGFKMGAWHDVGWWERRLGELMTDPKPPRPLAQLVETGEIDAALKRPA
jgi:phosphinothricin acetyltransferase